MIIFWIIVGIISVYYFFNRKNYNEKIKDRLIVLTLLAFSFLVIAIVTKDPIFSQFGVPLEYEWTVGLFITALASWKLYFNPLKNIVMINQRDIKSIKTSINHMGQDLHLIKEKILE